MSEQDKIVEARTFRSANEKEFWDWLGDAYLSSEDFGSHDESGRSEELTILKIQTPDGPKEVHEFDVIVKDGDTFTVLNPDEANEQLEDVDKESLS